MAVPRCLFCADLKVDQYSGRWHPFSGEPYDKVCRDIGDLQTSALTCPSGGCRILLEAVLKICPEAPKSTALDYLYSNKFIFEVAHNPQIQLFIDEGNCST
jgi:hypothetical protein